MDNKKNEKEKAVNTAIEKEVEAGTRTLVIRHDNPQIVHEESPINYTGAIKAASEFWNKRKKDYEINECSVEYSKHGNVSIKLNLHEKEKWRKGTVVGVLLKNPDIARLGINADRTFTIDEIKQLLRMNASYFLDREAHLRLISNFEKFHASVKLEVQDHNNNRGNITMKLEQQVKTDIPLDFTMRMPIFKGFEEKEFPVEIKFSITDGVTRTWFESPKLEEEIQKTINTIIDDELKNFKELVCIEL